MAIRDAYNQNYIMMYDSQYQCLQNGNNCYHWQTPIADDSTDAILFLPYYIFVVRMWQILVENPPVVKAWKKKQATHELLNSVIGSTSFPGCPTMICTLPDDLVQLTQKQVQYLLITLLRNSQCTAQRHFGDLNGSTLTVAPSSILHLCTTSNVLFC